MDHLDHQPQMSQSDFFDDAISPHGRNEGQSAFLHWHKNVPLDKDTPWAPMGMATNSRTMPDYLNNRAGTAAFQTYRSNPLPSDCDTVPGDSAYGSGVPASIENISDYGEDGFGSGGPNVEQELTGFHFGDQDTAVDHIQFTLADLNPALQPNDARPEPKFTCPDCRTGVRTKSELNKHIQRHRKPHECTHEDCDKKFASPNDLFRHRRTFHREHNTLEGRTYVCNHGSCAKPNPKFWPRADNFRCHLRRAHKLEIAAEDDLSIYLVRPNSVPEAVERVGINFRDPTNQSNSSGSVENASMKNMSPTSPISPADASSKQFLSPPRVILNNKHNLVPGSVNEGESQFIHPNMLNRHQEISYSPSQIATKQSSTMHTASTTRYAESLASRSSHAISRQASQTPTVQLSTSNESVSALQTESSDNEDIDMNEAKHSQADGKSYAHETALECAARIANSDRDVILEALGAFDVELLLEAWKSKNAKDSPPAESTPATKSKIQCPECPKQFERPCELRKHSRRHDRPYGCTVYKCDKSFGSKNDWKRHETSQHGVPEAWHCDEICKKIFYRREAFKVHLQQDHRLNQATVIDEKLRNNKLGSSCDSPFWCGFCKDLITNKAADITQSAVKRFDHIDEHFMGRNNVSRANITNWVHMENVFVDEDAKVLGPNRKDTQKGENSLKRKRARQQDPRPSKQAHIETN